MSVEKIDQFIHQLAQIPVAPDAFNQLAGDDPNNVIRRANLRLYLRQALERNANVLLLGEAPGYRGSRVTGVPMTSREIMLTGIPELEMFGSQRGYQNTADPGFENIQREATATIVWGTLVQVNLLPVIWGAFPFHPHEAGKPRSNRAPRRDETALGRVFVEQLVELFRFERIAAVGNVAEVTLKAMKLDYIKIRHPSHGGKNDFVAGIQRLLLTSEKGDRR